MSGSAGAGARLTGETRERPAALCDGCPGRDKSLEVVERSRSEKTSQTNPLTVIFRAEGMLKGGKSTKMALEIRKEIPG